MQKNTDLYTNPQNHITGAIMEINRKDLKKKGKASIKRHYFIFVITLLLCAVLGVFYTSSTYIFNLMKGGNDETYSDISAL